MIIDTTTILEFFSAYAQATAALVGLSATFAVFHYQNLKTYFTRKTEKIESGYETSFRGFMTEEQQEQFSDFISHEQRAKYIEPIYRSWLAPERAHEIKTKLNGERSRIHQFEMWAIEFNDYQMIKHRMRSFRGSFLAATLCGLASVTLGLFSIALVDLEALVQRRAALLVIASGLLLVYLVMLYRLLDQTFQKPE